MSSETENLGLFKYDPVADKDQTFNIDLALNQNWDTVDEAMAQREGLLKSSASKDTIADTDAVAVVDSADSSKTKRVLWSAIKSALNKLFVPLTRKINNKALSSDVTLTGADIKVSSSDETSVSTALSNKADCVAPPEYKVATADSWDTGSAAVYQRTQENMVCVCGEFRAIQNKSVEDGALLGTIPEGFRPRRYIVVPGSVQDGSDRLSCAVQFTASGNIIYNGKPNMSMSMFRIFINCTFFTN